MIIDSNAAPKQAETQALAHEIIDSKKTDCCIVGGGPAGVVLSLLLARQGISVILLEAHKDFDRDFRGDTVHPSTMQIMDELGLSDRLLQLQHAKIHNITIQTEGESLTLADLTHLKTKYPFIMMLPQVRFLEFIVEEAKRYPNFELITGANVQELIKEDDVVKGVLYRGKGGWHEVRALLTIGADGRHSRIRQLTQFEAVETSPPMDVLWFRLPRKPGEPEAGMGRVNNGHLLVMLNRDTEWQIAYVIPKGGYQQIRAEGMDALKNAIVETVPELGDRINHLNDWSQIAFLSVESSRLKRWYLPGLLLIGDAAHVMSPVGGVGINYAIQDAVVAANILSKSLKAGNVTVSDLAKVQNRRELPTRVIQAFQSLVQQRILAPALNSTQAFKPPLVMRLPVLRDIPLRLIAYGIWPVHVNL